MTRRIRFNAFDMNCVAHQSPGLWRHPEDQSHRYKELSYWTELAKLLERGRFDGIFIADVLGIYDVYGGNDIAALRQGAQVPVADPLLLVSAMAAVTEHLGFGITTGTGFEHPFPFARRLSTLDHLTNGRLGWNVVTGYLPSAAANMGESEHLDHDERYNHADEYLEVLYKLWEGSWEDDAVVRDRAQGIYVDPAKVHHIGHAGKHFTVPGIHLSEPSPQRTPVIYQAGASPRGVAFAAENAEAIFVAAPSKRVLAQTVTRIRDALEAAGRDRCAARVYALATIITDATDEAAQRKYDEYRSYASVEGGLVFMSGWMGIDLSRYDLDDPIGEVNSNAILSAVAAFQEFDDDGREWTVRDIAAWAGIGGMGPVFVGSGTSVADRLQEWVDETDIDGYNLAYAITPGTFEDIVRHVIPVLTERGAYPREYVPGTLRNALFGAGDRLPDDHRGARYRLGGPGSTALPDEQVRPQAGITAT
ncbi:MULTISPECIES: LLM class flavin-dependent oxidoreductase [Nocardia]|jgi:FMN-dependent oxidoreductase (nitrilotriacetate monooxygenase family)|uniref:LLM class flavin-dependent oxidoreductase n=1 Tax=Nocardia TaxID=1817 RepID=UPI0007E980D3|nr:MULTISPECIES: LLM class flavin-dependent oxidoreductase [Nocardia]OBF81733.1 5,10-methylene tetrahydromethanopterin reductase [Mycobacterium sp. 852002-51759_SCH5129042]MBF6275905.1 LLM class flavin-dependent oxidoreductase [Nocardia nova]MBV7701960.1 LLM class flavin-dependent oxidoreductase [Nocardia nova]OBA51901.1 5,10-methylene tetrahydromethanopterin reductase [Nocardia sp. 852002-51101_SCH5132738]OBB52330.1 5,10-methylene tetrahydromethanopterin reductase [Nocardia sp. 852002-51244_S